MPNLAWLLFLAWLVFVAALWAFLRRLRLERQSVPVEEVEAMGRIIGESDE